jgi:hypothetical protein
MRASSTRNSLIVLFGSMLRSLWVVSLVLLCAIYLLSKKFDEPSIRLDEDWNNSIDSGDDARFDQDDSLTIERLVEKRR